MRQILPFALAGSIALAMAGGAMAQSRDFDLKGFTQVEVNTGINAVITLGDGFAVHAESANQDLLDKLEVTLAGDTLNASIEQNFLDFIFDGGVVGQLLGANSLTLTITLPKLTGISASSSADIDVVGAKGDLTTIQASSGGDLVITGAALAAVTLDASSGSNVELRGACTALTVSASSGSDVEAGDLQCAAVTVDASSGSDVSVFASTSIKANASSGADITVGGNPSETALDRSSGGDITFED